MTTRAPTSLAAGLLAPGHVVEVVVTDAAGHSSTATATFTVETSVEDLAALFDRFVDDGAITTRGVGQLQAHLDNFERDLADGKTGQAVKSLEQFVKFATDDRNVDPEAAEVLLRNAAALLDAA